jgi:cytochrome c
MILLSRVRVLFTILGIALRCMARQDCAPRRARMARYPAKGNPVRRVFLITLILLAAACSRQETAATAGDPAHGRQLIERYGCTSCHAIPGIDGPRGEVGPSLDHVATRQLLAGKLPNNPRNMTQYLQNPQLTDPQNVMPNLGVKPDDARDIGAYLSTLK